MREMTLMREATFSLMANGRLGNFIQLAINTKADPVELLKRLEVNVRRAAADRVEQHLLDIPDDGRIVDFQSLLGRFLVLVFRREIGLDLVVDKRRQPIVGRPERSSQ